MTIEEMANSTYFMQQHSGSLTEEEYEDVKHGIEVRRKAYIEGANAVLEEIEKELRRRMLEDYNEGAEEDEVAQGCMATMICFIEQLKKGE